MHAKNLIAHRGDNTNYPENTLVAIEAALKAGAIYFEFDVQMNADKSLVVFHDVDFLRMNGVNKAKIFEVNDEEMQKISIHSPEKFGGKHFPISVTYFDEITELLKRYPEAHAFVEIKDDSLEFWGVDILMKKVVKSLKGFESQATIISFNEAALAYTKAHSDLSIGLVFEEYSERIKAIAMKLKPEHMVCWEEILPDEQVWQGDWQWMVYTVNNVQKAQELLKRGDIDFVETDDIQRLLKA